MSGTYTTYIGLKIGENTFVGDTEHQVSLNCIRNTNCTGSVVVELYDDSAYVIERMLLGTDTREIEYWFGYANESGEDKNSKRYKAVVQRVVPSFEGLGMLLTLEGIQTATYNSMEESKNRGVKVYQGTPDEIVRQVIADEGWIEGRIDPCRLIETDSSRTEGNSSEEITLTRESGVSAIDFINNFVVPLSMSDSGQADFRCFINETEDGVVVDFYPAGTGDTTASFTFVIGQNTEEIISWTPDYSERLSALMGSNGTSCATVESITNEGSEVLVQNTSDSAVVAGATAGAIAATKVSNKSDINQPTTLQGTKSKVQRSSASESEQEVLAINQQRILSNSSYNATLVLKGRPNLDPMSNIEVLCMTRDGIRHHSSGTYMIQAVEELLELGQYTTTLNLLKISASHYTVQRNKIGAGDGASVGNNNYNAMNTNGSTVVPTGRMYSPGRLLGEFKVTAYCSCKICCGQYSPEVTGRPSKTASGTTPKAGWTIATDWSVIPKNTLVMIEGNVYRAEDKGGAIKGNDIDIYFDDHQSAVRWGVKYLPVYMASESDIGGGTVTIPSGGEIPDSIYYQTCQKYLNIPYVWGGESMEEGGYDCSGFVWAICSELGYSWGRDTASGQASYGVDVPLTGTGYQLDSAKPGDLLFNYNGTKISHVMMYLGNGYMVHAPKRGDVIRIAKVYQKPYCIRRLFE